MYWGRRFRAITGPLPCLSGMPIVFLGDRFVSSYPTHSNRRQDARRDYSLSCLSTTRLSLDFAACPHLAPLSASGTSHLSPNVKSKFSPQRSPSCLSACLPTCSFPFALPRAFGTVGLFCIVHCEHQGSLSCCACRSALVLA